MDKQLLVCAWIMIFSLYALAILSTFQLAGAIYMLSTGTIDTLCVWELTLGIFSVGEYQNFSLR